MDEHKAENVESAAVDEQERPPVDIPGVANIIPAPEPIEVYRRGHPLPQDLRARVMLYLQQGLRKQTIASRLCISRSTVLRYQQAAAEQNNTVPQVRPRNGYRSSVALLNREQILKLGEMLLQQPKLTIRELKQLAVETRVLDPEKVPSDTTIWRGIRKLNLDFSKASYADPKGLKQQAANERKGDEEKLPDRALPDQAQPAMESARVVNSEEADLIAAERKAFKFVQKQGVDGQLSPRNLIFMDETNTRAFDQAHYAWGRKHQRKLLFRPKGMSPTFNVIACIGVEEDTPGQMFLHYIIVPPRRDFRGVPTRWKAYEFRNPTAGIDVGFSVAQIQHSLRFDELKDLMKAQQVKIPQGFPTDVALESELRRLLVQIRTHGKVGMLREMPQKQRYLGGSIKAFRSTAADVVDYIEKLMIPFYVKRKFSGLVNECSEDSDGVIGCPDAGQHFSVPYVAPVAVNRLQLLQQKQRTQRQLQRAAHRLLVYSRSRRAQTEAGEVMMHELRAKEQEIQHKASAAADAWTRHERQMVRAGSFIPFQDEIAGVGYKRRLANKYLVWDCASTHGAVKIASARKKSFWHEYAKKAGMKGVVFLPPRTPTLNPIELVFGFLKHHVRKNCPDEGYSSTGLIQAIHSAFRMVTPTMIKNWVKKAGYRFSRSAEEEPTGEGVARALPNLDDGPVSMDIDDPDEQEEKYAERKSHNERQSPDHVEILQDDADVQEISAVNDNSPDCYSEPGVRYRRKRSIVCMDSNGTIIRKKQRRNITFDRSLDEKLQLHLHWKTSIVMQDVAPLVNKMQSVTSVRGIPYSTAEEAFASVGLQRRWSGLGPEPEHLQEMMPERIMKVNDGTLWEIDGIVEHRRTRSGVNEFLVRYKGYGPEYDEWMEEDTLSTAAGALKEYWARRALRSK